MISVNRKIKGGLPVIQGTRLSVIEVLQALKDGYTITQFINNCKKEGVKVQRKDVEDAIDFASGRVGTL